ncbi:MAG: ATP-binding protein [Hyphomonadaceae bacterium]
MSKTANAAAIGVRRAWLGVGAPIIGLVAVIIALAVFVFASFAQDQNRAFERNSATLVFNGLEGRARMMGAIGLDYANWDAAFENVSARWNQEWIDDNFYSSVADLMILFRQNGTVRYSWASDAYDADKDSLAAIVAEAGARLPNLRRLSRAPAVADTVALTYARSGDNLLIIAVVPITREDDAARIAYNPLSGYDYFAVVKVIDVAGFAQANRSMSLDDFHMQPADAPVGEGMISLPVVTPAGNNVGNLVWRNTHPGTAIFLNRIWPVVIGLLLIGALTLLITRHLVVRQIGAMAGAEAALEASRVKSEFLAKVGHELRTPLNGIIGYAEIIQEETESETAHADAQRIINAARHLNELLKDILDQSRLNADRIVVKREVLPVVGMVAEVQGLMLPSARAAGVNLTVQPSAAANYVVADHVRLRQCLINLIGNAIKFAPRGNVTIKTRIEERSRGDAVIFDVADDGIGIAKSDQDRLFKPFSQANEQISQIYGGAGLGLSIARDLARAMGGDITVLSAPGEGATFSLAVPVASPKALQAA